MFECWIFASDWSIQVCTSIDVQRDVIISNRGKTFTTQTRKPGAEVVGALPDDEEKEEEDRGGRYLEEDEELSLRKIERLRKNIFEDRTESTEDHLDKRKKKKVVELLRKLLLE